MADSEDAIQLQRRARRRLVGAIALVVLTVIVLPIIFDKEPRPISQDLVIQIPSQDTGRFNSRVLPASPDGSGPAAKSAPPAPASSSPAPPAASSAPAQDPVPAKPGMAKETIEPKRAPAAPPPQAAPAAERFVVALGAYTNRDNVKQLQAKASAAGFKTFTETLKAPKGDQLRVRAGPFVSRDAAEQARDKLKAQGLPAGAVVRQDTPRREP